MSKQPDWLKEHRKRQGHGRPSWMRGSYSREINDVDDSPLLADKAFNNHDKNDGKHVSPYDDARVDVGTDNLVVRLVQGINEEQMRTTLRRTIRATNGIDPSEPAEATDPEEMFKGGLQTALETQVVVFEVIGASRVLTHQLVRSRRASFHQQSQRATWYGDGPNARMPMSVFKDQTLRDIWGEAQDAAWEAYRAACDAGVSYQDARYILPEGTTNYILCEYSIREFIAMFAYRGCSMFQWEMVQCVREMRRVLLEAHPFLEPYIKISCEKTPPGGTAPDQFEHQCTFQGWEDVEKGCDFPWAKQDNRVFLPSPRNRIGG